MTKSFGSDNHAGAHEAVLRMLAAANAGDAHGYGDDPWTKQVSQDLRARFGAADAYFVFNGTGANVVGLIGPIGHAHRRPGMGGAPGGSGAMANMLIGYGMRGGSFSCTSAKRRLIGKSMLKPRNFPPSTIDSMGSSAGLIASRGTMPCPKTTTRRNLAFFSSASVIMPSRTFFNFSPSRVSRTSFPMSKR